VKFLKKDEKLGTLAFEIDLKIKDQFTEFLDISIFPKITQNPCFKTVRARTKLVCAQKL
jgi:hypothetical protein